GGSTPLYTVQIGLKELLGTEVSQIPVSLAGAVIAFVPLAILLLIFQKQLVRSLTGGAVKESARPPTERSRARGNTHADPSSSPIRCRHAVRHGALRDRCLRRHR